jgi:4-amino-4-deoxy-L-arabinose transferase-like glycosyltransferase
MTLNEQGQPKGAPLRGFFWSPTFIASFAFGVHLLTLYFVGRHETVSGPYGYEAGRIAESIASGRGFSSPLGSVQTGATAWLCPIFPYLMAAVFRVCGIFTLASLLAIQVLNCAFASLTVFPIHAIAKRSFGAPYESPYQKPWQNNVALLASWLWVILPSALHTPVADIWDTSLTGLLFALIFWSTLAIREEQSALRWASYGALWAVGVLTNASMLSVFPFFIGWLVFSKREASAGRLARVALSVFVLALLLMPWAIRNHRALGERLPLRSNFGLELWLGNNPAGNDVNSFALHPFQNPLEASRFKSLGEIEYMKQKEHEAIAFMRANPGATLHLVARRVALYWFAVSDRPRFDWSTAPRYVRYLVLPNLLMILFAWFGAPTALRRSRPGAMLFVLALLVFPIPYYITHALVRYRFPLDPILAILGVYGVLSAPPWTQRWGAFRRAA